MPLLEDDNCPTDPLSMDCALCGCSLEPLSESERQDHYDAHFEEESQQAGTSSGNVVAERASNSNDELDTKEENGLFWTSIHASKLKVPSNFTPGLIPILRKALHCSHYKGTTRRAALCHEGVYHIASQFLDRTYGCGYRNYMMACSALYEQQVIPQYHSLIEQHGSPGIKNLQALLERAWMDGFDEIGASQLKHKLKGTMKWIGTGELYTAFSYQGIPARLIDFPQSGGDAKVVTNWVTQYFFPEVTASNLNNALMGASPIVQTEKPPLVLQHQGHSRTIVGIEINRLGVPNLLVFDPAKRIPGPIRKQALSSLSSHLEPGETEELKGLQSNMVSGSPSVSSTGDIEGNSHAVESSRGKGIKGFLSTKPTVKSIINKSGDSDSSGILNLFRVSLSNLKKRDKYQILAFTLEPPLHDAERSARKIVRSEKVL